MRREYEMTEEERTVILNAARPTVCMVVGGVMPRDPRDNINDAWIALGKKRGFDHRTTRPVSGKSNHFFTAEEIAKEPN